MTELFFEQEIAMMNAFKHLSECFLPPESNLRESAQKLLENLRHISSEAAEHAEKMVEALKEEGLTSLQVEFAALFVGPYRLLAPPYGSVYLEDVRRVMGDSTIDVLRYYQQAGVDVADDFNEPPDHIVTELEFISFLTYKQIEARQDMNIEAAENYKLQCTRFFNNHLANWWSPFAENMEKGATTSFYKELSKCLRGLFIRFSG